MLFPYMSPLVPRVAIWGDPHKTESNELAFCLNLQSAGDFSRAAKLPAAHLDMFQNRVDDVEVVVLCRQTAVGMSQHEPT